MIATTAWTTPTARQSADPAGLRAAVVTPTALVDPAAVAQDDAGPPVAIFSLPEVAALRAPAVGGERRRRVRWVGWIRRRVIHVEGVRKFT